MRLKLRIAYDGTPFEGWQSQPSGNTVQDILEAATEKIQGLRSTIHGSGRTDAGVHASGQVVSFSTGSAFPLERLCVALNSELPDDLAIRESACVESSFSARFPAIERTYVYALFARPARAPLLTRHAYHVWLPIDLQRVRMAAAALLGERDFRSFCGLLPEGGVTVREVRRLRVERREDLIRIEISATGFLHRMVRTIVGTLVDCGTGRRAPDEMPAVLAARDRRAAGHTAPPHGLYLAGVRYDGFDSYAEPPIFRWG
jgi:tRNA pseudouridine38-40 synthase